MKRNKITNPLKAQYDGYKSEKDSWNPKWKTATAIGDAHWNVEISISFKELRADTPRPGQVWGFNLTRARRAGELEISGWSFVNGSNHTPERFGYLIFK